MLKISILPAQWRAQKKMSLAAMAVLVGINGRNPARTWHRWETGERQPPLSVMLKVEALSGGQVSMASWVAARHAHICPQPATAGGHEARA